MWIRKANLSDIATIEYIFRDVLDWFETNNMNHWKRDELSWEGLRHFHHHSEFYIAYVNGMPAGCVALCDFDPAFWPNIKKGQSIYIHKLAVMRKFAGKGVSQALINFAKAKAMRERTAAVRLDCGQTRMGLRKLYEREGFICVDERTMFGSYDTAFYMCPILLPNTANKASDN